MRVFTYGTLRPDDAEASHVLYNHQLFDYGPFPYISTSLGGKVYGNLLTVSNADLRELDRIEGTAKGLYTRERVLVRELGSVWFEWVYVYVGKIIADTDPQPHYIPRGDWKTYVEERKGTERDEPVFRAF